MSVLKPVNTPLVLVHLHVYLLATYNAVDINDCREWGRFGFGGRHTSINQMMQPYMVALEDYQDYKEQDFYKFLSGAKQICEFKYFLLHTPHMDNINRCVIK
jgi:hypothetical protein